jgi:hypothetical protein
MIGEGSIPENPTKPPDAKARFLKDICAYFRDFLDTDFKRQPAGSPDLNNMSNSV